MGEESPQAKIQASGEALVIGAPGGDAAGSGVGTAHVFRWTGEMWEPEALLVASDSASQNLFGISVSMSNNLAVVGAPGYYGAGNFSGAAYVFTYNGTSWMQEAKLTASDAGAGDFFGITVSITEDVAVIGAYLVDSHDNGTKWDSGAAYVFRYNGSAWTPEAKLTASDAAAGDFFGSAVSLSEDTVLVGAWGDDDAGNGSGSAYVFKYNGKTWEQEAKLAASDATEGHGFGSSVSIARNVAVVGAPGHSYAGPSTGAAYVFANHGSVWEETLKLTASDAVQEDMFGTSVSISGKVIAIGAPHKDGAKDDSGSAYIIGLRTDCNTNGALDECDIADGTSQDCDGNKLPDECDIYTGRSPDCNGNGVPDQCDLATGISHDCNSNGIPDECESDCNGNGIDDSCDIAVGFSQDCNANRVPDECDIATGTSSDCQPNGIPDSCEWLVYQGERARANTVGFRMSSLCQSPDQQMHGGAFIAPIVSEYGGRVAADGLSFAQSTRVDTLRWWGTYRHVCGEPCEAQDDFVLSVYVSEGELANRVVATYDLGGQVQRARTEQIIPLEPDLQEYEYTAILVPPFTVEGGERYWAEVRNGALYPCVWCWETAPRGDTGNGTSLYGLPGEGYSAGDLTNYDLAFCISGWPASEDCNGNGVADSQDITDGTSADCQPNGIPDECEDDRNFNAIPDACDISTGSSRDVNFNGVPDEAECLGTPGDLDSDCDLDLDDFALLRMCLGESGIDILDGCTCADLDNNGSIGFRDYLAFQFRCGIADAMCRIRLEHACPDSWATAGSGQSTAAGFGGEETHYDFGTHGPIPAGFFAEGSDPFAGLVTLVGRPVDPSGVYGEVDTQILHGPVIFDPDTGMGEETALDIMTLDLTSKAPITVTYGGANEEEWLVVAGLSRYDPGSGVLSASLNEPGANAGTFNATVYVQPAFLFVKRQDLIDGLLPECVAVRVLDTGRPGQYDRSMPPLTLSFTGQPFVRVADTSILEQANVPDCAQGNFVPGVVETIVAMRAGQQLTCTSHETPGEAHYFCPPECQGEDVCLYQASGPPTPVEVEGVPECVQLPDFPLATLGQECPGGTADCPSHEIRHKNCPGGGSAFQVYANPVCVPRESTCKGACCNERRNCVLSTSALCEGFYRGDDTKCDPNDCPHFGACCQVDGTCSLVREPDCPEGDWIVDASCDPNPCAGACCEADGTCTILSEYECQELGGLYQGHISMCDPNPCSGACCEADGTCTILSEQECQDVSGLYQGHNTTCDPDPCSGACCEADGTCTIFTQQDCDMLGGVYQGHRTTCDPNPCSGACCETDGTCTRLTEEECQALDGAYQGHGTTCDPNPCPEIDLEIHKPKVIDPAASVIPDADELTMGAQTLVNLDNDDQDSLFDAKGATDDTDVPGEDEMTLLKLKVKPTDLEATVTLSATAGGGNIKVWDSANKGTEVALPKTYIVPDDFPDIEGAWRVKTVWLEGRSPHTAQRQTKLKMELDNPAPNNPDEVALTIIGIDTIEWIGKSNSLNDDNTLDADSNWPGGVDPGSVRVFPGARVVGGAVEADPRDTVDVKVTLTVDPIEPVKIYFESFDVDDPTSATHPIDDPGPAAGDETLEEDNRGTTPAESGQFVKTDGSDDETGGLKEHEFPDKEETFLFRTTMHSGDNFRIVGNGDKDFLADLENKDSDYAGNNNDKQRIVNKHVTGTAAQREVREVVNYASDEVLTVWRFLHVETDSMVAVPVPPNAGHNRIITTLTGIRSGTTELTVAAALNDGSADLDDVAPENGRFDNGTVRIGTGGGLVTINNIVGNGNDFVRHTGVIGLPFTVSAAGGPPPPDAGGTVTALAGNTFTVNVTAGALNNPGHNGGTMTMAGASMTITTVNPALNQVNVAAHGIPVDIRDDDDEGVLPEYVDFTGMATPYAEAYILPLADGGTAAANNQQNVDFVANATGQQLDNNNMHQDTPAAAEQDRFWVAYLCSAFQYTTGSDDDPQTEGGTGGVSFSATSNVVVATGGDACWVLLETCRDRLNNDVPPAAAGLVARDAAHEMGHQLGLNHINNTLMNPSLQTVPADPGFADVHVHLLRSRVHSPGQ